MKGKRVLKKQRQLNNSLSTYFMSLFSVLLSFVMLLGTTFAWFYTDNTSTGNEIHSGILKVDMLHVTSGGEISLDEQPAHAVFSSGVWVPEKTQVETIKVLNAGNVMLDYRLSFVPGEENTATLSAESMVIAGLFKVYVKQEEVSAAARSLIESRGVTEADGWKLLGTLDTIMASKSNVYLAEGKALGDGESHSISIALQMGTPLVPDTVMNKSAPLYLKLEAFQHIDSVP